MKTIALLCFIGIVTAGNIPKPDVSVSACFCLFRSCVPSEGICLSHHSTTQHYWISFRFHIIWLSVDWPEFRPWGQYRRYSCRCASCEVGQRSNIGSWDVWHTGETHWRWEVSRVIGMTMRKHLRTSIMLFHWLNLLIRIVSTHALNSRVKCIL